MSEGIPVVDVFAGCGGLSEGFFAEETKSTFDLALALDSDPWAHATHQLRAFYHQFSPGDTPKDYYDLLRGEISLKDLYANYPREARRAAQTVLQWELGGEDYPDSSLRKKIEIALAGHEDWVLVGGPPCQAYSIAGRARNRGIAEYVAAEDHRHFLYKEYLKILHHYRPSIFVMENVKGLLNSKIDGRHIWHLMLEDLINPSEALGEDATHNSNDRRFDGYRVYSLVTPDRGLDIFGVPQIKREEYIVSCEDHGIPQNRHRVLLCGVRADIDLEPKYLERQSRHIPAKRVLSDLPKLRSGLSRTTDSSENWLDVVRGIADSEWLKNYAGPESVREALIRTIEATLKAPSANRGGNFVGTRRKRNAPSYQPQWFEDPRLGGYCNHETKAHMESDLHRYMFAACYAMAKGESIKLSHFPAQLLPQHENIKTDSDGVTKDTHFVDRFSVQRGDRPSSTVVSHIAKDGHYFIHPDPAQCRSLTVREAARLQTFPDNFFFLGNRTEQYRQVGNAVPPLLSYQIAQIIQDLLRRSGRLEK